MPTLPAIGPVDGLGRLVHEDDAAAQLALSMSRVEAELAAAGRSPADLGSVVVLTTDRRVLDPVYDVLAERLDALGVEPVVTVEDVRRLGVPGMVVALVATTVDAPSAADVGRRAAPSEPT